MLGRGQRPLPEFDQCVVRGQTAEGWSDRSWAQPPRVIGRRLRREARRLGPLGQPLETGHIGLARGPRIASAAADRHTWTLETHADRPLRFPDLDDGALDHHLAWPPDERP